MDNKSKHLAVRVSAFLVWTILNHNVHHMMSWVGLDSVEIQTAIFLLKKKKVLLH